MKIHNLVIAACVLLALTGLLYWSGRHKAEGDTTKLSADTPPAILKLEQASVTKIELKKKNASPLELSKSSSGDWKITQPKPLAADQSNVSSLLASVSSLNSERLVEDHASDLKTYGLEQPSLELDIAEKDNKSQKLLLGDDTPAGGGVYAMLAGDPRIFTIASYNKNSLDKSVNDLRDKRLLTVAADKISRVELIAKNQDLEFGRNKDEWQILKPRPLRADGTEVGDLITKLTDAKMDISGSNGDQSATFAQAAPVATAKVTDQSGTQELQIRKSKDTYFAKSSIVDGAYKIDSELGKEVAKGLDDFRNKKLFDFGYSEPNKIELHSEGKAYFLTRSTKGDDWWSNGKKMDAASVDALISKLRELATTKFVDSGFSNPSIAATVASDDGKRTEKIEIAKAGDHYLGKRENETTLYQLDASSVREVVSAAEGIKPAPSIPEQAPKKP